MALTVKETKAGNRPAGGYRSNDVKLRGSHPLSLRTDTILKQRPLASGSRATGQARGKRGSTSRPVLGPMRTRARSILP